MHLLLVFKFKVNSTQFETLAKTNRGRGCPYSTDMKAR